MSEDGARLRDLRARFEAPKPAPRPERISSRVDAPLPAVSNAARAAARRSADSIAKLAPDSAQAARRRVPSARPGDSDEVRDLKRALAARDAEVQTAAAKLEELANRLARIGEAFRTSDIALANGSGIEKESARKVERVFAEQVGQVSNGRVDTGRKEMVDVASPVSNVAPSPAASASSNSLEAILAAARAPVQQKKETPKPSASASNNSLEAILAAARGGKSAGGGAKYSKMLRDFK